MKKFMLLFIISIILTGCEQTIDLTSEEELILAEEMSDLVLSYDERYQKHLTKNKSNKDKQDNNIEVKDKIVEPTEDADKQTDSAKGDSPNADTEKDIYKSLLDSKNQYFWDYSDDIEVELVGYDIVNNLPDNKDDFYYVGPISDSNSNKGILRLSFNVINHTSKEADFTTLDSDFEFSLKVGNAVYYPLITFLPNDIQFMDIKLEAKEQQVMILLYSVPENLNLDEVMFSVENSSAKHPQISKLNTK